jgi:hypothetical protein
LRVAGLQGRVLTRQLAPVPLVALALGTWALVATAKDQELSGAQIRAAFVGKIVTDGFHWADYLLPDGSVKSIELERSRFGHWRISGNELCLSVPAGAAFECRTVVRAAKGYVFRANGQNLYEVTVEAPSARYHFYGAPHAP